MSKTPHLFIYELQHHSHSASFVTHWANQWRNLEIDGRLTILLDRPFLDLHPELSTLSSGDGAVQLITLSEREQEKREAFYVRPDGQSIDFYRLLSASEEHRFAGDYEWALFHQYHHKLGATHSAAAYMDHYLPLLARPQHSPSRFSGLMFRPIFHLPAEDASDVETFKARQLREKLFLASALRHSGLHSLFVIDERVVETAGVFEGGEKVIYLPEAASVETPSLDDVQQLKQQLQTGGRTIFLVFGHLTHGKNIDRFLAALHLLPEAVVKRVALLLVGYIKPGYQRDLDDLTAEATLALPVQIIKRYGFASEADAALYLQAADAVVTLYDEQHGPSNVNLKAAAAGTPVLTTDQGIIGRTAKSWAIGLTVDVTDIRKIAEGIQRIVQASTDSIYDPYRMRDLAAKHTGKNFAETFYGQLGFLP